MSKDSPRLSRLGVLAPAALSVCMDASVLAVPAAGAIVSTVLKELSKAFMLKKWYHGIMSAKEAEHLMLERGRNGSFLVRESQTHPGEYVLTVRVHGRVSHVMIRKRDNKYDVGSGEQFDDLVGLIEHFRSYPIIETSGDVLRLLQPVSGVRLRANGIEHKVQKMSYSQRAGSSGVNEDLQHLKIIDNVHVFTHIEGAKDENSDKNRFRNILPYDQTRVILKKSNEYPSDYINANYIRTPWIGYSTSFMKYSNESINRVNSLILQTETKKSVPLVTKSSSDDALRKEKRCVRADKFKGNFRRNLLKDKVYIAAQGCLKNTTKDFWRMLWQEDVRVITMIAKEMENGKKKCERYWPSYGEEICYDDLTIKSMSETSKNEFLLREFDVSDKNTCRTMYQYQYKNWPDHGVPRDPNAVLTLIEDVNRRMYRIAQEKDAPEHNILCVHCSAGVGRTGSFIVLDMLIDSIKRSSKSFNCDLDVSGMVKFVRAQRLGMVQNKTQYKFIQSAIQNYIDKYNIQPETKE